MPSETVRPRASRVPHARDMPQGPYGVWLLATTARGGPAPLDEPYPHVCGHTVVTRQLRRRDCAACGAAK